MGANNIYLGKMSIVHKYLRYQITSWYSVVQEGTAQSFQPGPFTFNPKYVLSFQDIHIHLIQSGPFMFNLRYIVFKISI